MWVFNIFNSVTMALRMVLVRILQSLTMFLIPAEASAMIRSHMVRLREEWDGEPSEGGVGRGVATPLPIASPEPSPEPTDYPLGETVTTTLQITDLPDGSLSLSLALDPSRNLSELMGSKEPVECSMGEALGQSIVKAMVAAHGADKIKYITLPGGTRQELRSYGGYVIIGELTEERKAEIDEQNSQNGTDVTGNKRKKRTLH